MTRQQTQALRNGAGQHICYQFDNTSLIASCIYTERLYGFCFLIKVDNLFSTISILKYNSKAQYNLVLTKHKVVADYADRIIHNEPLGRRQIRLTDPFSLQISPAGSS